MTRRYDPRRIQAKPVYDLEGERFHASQAEARRWAHLELLERTGEISDLQHQPKVELEPGISWKPDSSYIENGRRVWEDQKGGRPMTPRENLLVKLWRLHGPGLLRIVDPKGKTGWKVRKEVYPK